MWTVTGGDPSQSRYTSRAIPAVPRGNSVARGNWIRKCLNDRFKYFTSA